MILGTYIDRGVTYTFVSSRRCRAQTVWERRPGTRGYQPFGAVTADYHSVEVRSCDKCPAWAGKFNYQDGMNAYKVYVCRCKQCAHPPFNVEEWLGSERGVKFMQSKQDRITGTISADLARRKNWQEFDDLVEVIQIAVDFMDAGALEEAKHALTDKLDRLIADGLLTERSNPDGH